MINYKDLYNYGFSEKWINNIKNNWENKTSGKYIMGIYQMDEFDQDPRSGKLIETTYFDTSEDMDKIHKCFEGLGYVMADAETNATVGEGIINYTTYEEMEAYTGKPWIANVHSDAGERLYNMSDERKIELFDSMLGHLVQLWDTDKLISNLCCMGFTAAELKAEEIDVDCEIAERITDFMFDSGYAEIPCYFKSAGINTKNRTTAMQDVLSLLSKGETAPLKESINNMLNDWDDYLKEEHAVEGNRIVEILDALYSPIEKPNPKQLQFLIKNASNRATSHRGKEPVIQEHDK